MNDQDPPEMDQATKNFIKGVCATSLVVAIVLFFGFAPISPFVLAGEVNELKKEIKSLKFDIKWLESQKQH